MNIVKELFTAPTLCFSMFVSVANTGVAAACSSEDAQEALALNIYHEARDQGLEGMIMVAEVTMNRVVSTRYPDNVCDVVYQPSQFSWTLGDMTDNEFEDLQEWDLANEVAIEAILGRLPYFGTGATHYLNPDKLAGRMPNWSNEFEMVGRVGDHVFYREEEV